VVEQYREEHEQQEKRERLIEAGLGEIYPHLQKLEREYEFDEGLFTLEQELKPAIREALEEELEGDESAEEVAKLVKRFVRDELGV